MRREKVRGVLRWEKERRGGSREEVERSEKRLENVAGVTHRSTTVFTVSHCCFRHTTVLHRDNMAACCCST